MRFTILLYIISAAAATIIPRLLPFLLKDNKEPPRFLKHFLTLIPVAALGALIFPAVFLSFPSFPAAGLLGVLAAGIAAWIRGGLVLPVLASILVTFLALTYLG